MADSSGPGRRGRGRRGRGSRGRGRRVLKRARSSSDDLSFTADDDREAVPPRPMYFSRLESDADEPADGSHAPDEGQRINYAEPGERDSDNNTISPATSSDHSLAYVDNNPSPAASPAMDVEGQGGDSSDDVLASTSALPIPLNLSLESQPVQQEETTAPADLTQTTADIAESLQRTPSPNPDLYMANVQRSPSKVHGGKIRTGGDFGATIRRNGIVVDKSLICRVFWEDRTETTCVHLPRRFGKTFNLSIIEEFFNVVTMRDMPRGSKSFVEEQGKTARRRLFDQSLLETEAPRFFEDNFCRYPVIRLCFKEVGGSTQQEYYRSLMFRALETVDTWVERLYDVEIMPRASESWKKLCRYYKKVEEELENTPISEWSKDLESVLLLIRDLMEFLSRQFDQRLVVLIDEYDVPLTVSRGKDWAGDARAKYASFLSSIFKHNEYLEKGLLVGVHRFDLTDVWSGVNNVRHYNLMAHDASLQATTGPHRVIGKTADVFADYFGYSLDEVRELLQKTGVLSGQRRAALSEPDIIDTMRKWYDGYRIGWLTGRYNPYACIQFVGDLSEGMSLGESARCHWEKTGNQRKVTEIAITNREAMMGLALQLTQAYDCESETGLAITGSPSHSSRLAKSEVVESISVAAESLPRDLGQQLGRRELVTLLLYAGYLTLDKEGCIQIPNGELRTVWDDLLHAAAMGTDRPNIWQSSRAELLGALYVGNVGQLFSYFSEALEHVSAKATGVNKYRECHYADIFRCFFYGLICRPNADNCSNTANIPISFSREGEAGRGKYDWRLHVTLPNGKQLLVLIEFKWIKTTDPDAPLDYARYGLEQITFHRYVKGVERVSRRLDIGIAVGQKKMCMRQRLWTPAPEDSAPGRPGGGYGETDKYVHSRKKYPGLTADKWDKKLTRVDDGGWCDVDGWKTMAISQNFRRPLGQGSS